MRENVELEELIKQVKRLIKMNNTAFNEPMQMMMNSIDALDRRLSLLEKQQSNEKQIILS
jgi:hypothetical protein